MASLYDVEMLWFWIHGGRFDFREMNNSITNSDFQHVYEFLSMTILIFSISLCSIFFCIIIRLWRCESNKQQYSLHSKFLSSNS